MPPSSLSITAALSIRVQVRRFVTIPVPPYANLHTSFITLPSWMNGNVFSNSHLLVSRPISFQEATENFTYPWNTGHRIHFPILSIQSKLLGKFKECNLKLYLKPRGLTPQDVSYLFPFHYDFSKFHAFFRWNFTIQISLQDIWHSYLLAFSIQVRHCHPSSRHSL